VELQYPLGMIVNEEGFKGNKSSFQWGVWLFHHLLNDYQSGRMEHSENTHPGLGTIEAKSFHYWSCSDCILDGLDTHQRPGGSISGAAMALPVSRSG
jgi:hypothetical protein